APCRARPPLPARASTPATPVRRVARQVLTLARGGEGRLSAGRSSSRGGPAPSACPSPTPSGRHERARAPDGRSRGGDGWPGRGGSWSCFLPDYFDLVLLGLKAFDIELYQINACARGLFRARGCARRSGARGTRAPSRAPTRRGPGSDETRVRAALPP